MSASVCFRN